MTMLRAANVLTDAEVEAIEKQTLRWVTQALLDYAPDIWDEFRNSPDDADGVAEDVTQESLNRLSGFSLDRRRLYGTVDYRRARYAILPEFITAQALFVDSKAEKSGASGRIQINQSSIRVMFQRPDGTIIDVPGGLGITVTLADGTTYLATTIFAHYHYVASPTDGRRLRQIKVIALPNGRLEATYVVSAADTIWNVGPDAPTRGEAQRARISFARLKARTAWRVQSIVYTTDGTFTFTWDD
jgi:Type II restriction enzyme SfiI